MKKLPATAPDTDAFPCLVNQSARTLTIPKSFHGPSSLPIDVSRTRHGSEPMYFTRACFYAAVCAYLMPVSVLVAGLNYANAARR